jgi:ribosome-associated toxin RatA of RatAB toxin-antitoxin module
MHTENQLVMNASPDRIFRLASMVERWPDILPHYRWVEVLEAQGDRKRVAMAARRGRIPVSWVADETLFPTEPRIAFRHVGGVTRGMDVEWHFEPQPGGTLVRIAHDLELPWPVIGPTVAQGLIGPHFVAAIAGQTLRRIRELAEAEERLAGGR